MKRSTKIIITSGAVLIALSGIAVAAKGYQNHQRIKKMFAPERIMQQLDTNGDNAISFDELNFAVAKRFAYADGDGNGSVIKADVVSAIEENAPFKRMKKHSGRVADRLFIGIDINQDGTMTKSEIENRLAKFYALADWNDDGKVEMAEMKRLRSSMPGRWGKRGNHSANKN
jgi:Ca2+-binding EF-hand superfamily protein